MNETEELQNTFEKVQEEDDEKDQENTAELEEHD